MTAETAHIICTLITEIDDLKAENMSLKAELASTKAMLGTAKSVFPTTGGTDGEAAHQSTRRWVYGVL